MRLLREGTTLLRFRWLLAFVLFAGGLCTALAAADQQSPTAHSGKAAKADDAHHRHHRHAASEKGTHAAHPVAHGAHHSSVRAAGDAHHRGRHHQDAQDEEAPRHGRHHQDAHHRGRHHQDAQDEEAPRHGRHQQDAHHRGRHHQDAQDEEAPRHGRHHHAARHHHVRHLAHHRRVVADVEPTEKDGENAAAPERQPAPRHEPTEKGGESAAVPERQPAPRHEPTEKAEESAATPERQPVHRRIPLRLGAAKAMVVQEDTGEILFEKNIDQVTPIASVTKLMTAMVVLDRSLPMDEEITILDEDVDHMKHSSSRLQVGTELTRREALQLALMSSENRAAAALGRTYPGSTAAFVVAMNHKAQELKMSSSYFADPTGLNSANVSTAEDLVKMVRAARHYEMIHEITTTCSSELGVGRKKRPTTFINTNRLVRGGSWDIGLSKTGYISEAGHCLVMQARIDDVPVIMTLLDNSGKYSCQADAVRIRQWIQRQRSN